MRAASEQWAGHSTVGHRALFSSKGKGELEDQPKKRTTTTSPVIHTGCQLMTVTHLRRWTKAICEKPFFEFLMTVVSLAFFSPWGVSPAQPL